MTMRSRCIQALFTLLPGCFLVQGTTLPGQSQSSSAAPNNPAMAMVQQAIAAMGGAAWAGVGAATAQMTESYPQPNIPSIVSVKSDDWSQERVRHRSESAKPSGKSSVSVDTEKAHVIKSASGKLTATPSNYDLVDLAQLYPAAALQIALRRSQCTLKALPAASGESPAVQQDCRVPLYPKSNVRFTWWFSGSGLPQKLQFPVLSRDGKFVMYQTAIFRNFQQIQGLTVTQNLEIQINQTTLRSLTLSDVSFLPNLPDAKFSIQ